MDYITIKEASEKWGLSIRRTQEICDQGKVPGVMKFGRDWAIPRDAEKPVDKRVKCCFSQFRAYLGGEDPKRNPNRGIERGCMAGRAFFAVRADGSFAPCLRMEETGSAEEMSLYWKKLTSDLHEDQEDSCKGCHYIKRCRPCPVKKEWTVMCPVRI